MAGTGRDWSSGPWTPYSHVTIFVYHTAICNQADGQAVKPCTSSSELCYPEAWSVDVLKHACRVLNVPCIPSRCLAVVR